MSRMPATAPVRPGELLMAAERLLTSPLPPSPGGDGSRMEGHWPRACAPLIRLALESALDEYWVHAAFGHGMLDAGTVAVAARFAGGEAAVLARESWLGLSRAAQHHAYELAPAVAELRE